MTDGQPEIAHDSRKDVVIVLRHYRFILFLLVAAIVVALLTGLAADVAYTATTEVEIDVTNVTALSGRNDLTPKLETFEELATSDEVATEVAARLADARTPSELLNLISIRATASTPANPGDRITIDAEGSLESDALTLAGTWAEVLAEKASATTVDPEAVRSLQAARAATQARLDEVDPTATRELASTSADLSNKRQRLIGLRTSIAELDDALAFIRDHPEVSLDELRVALGVLLAEVDNPPYETPQELANGLQLRRDFLSTLTPRIEAQIEELVQQEEDLSLESAEFAAARAALQGTQQNLVTADVLAATATVTADVIPGTSTVSGGVNWLARIGAAAAFGLVAGVAGAFALEYLGPSLRSWRRRSGWPPQEEG
jgi:capsular polysaccharide biosynthesis protein